MLKHSATVCGTHTLDTKFTAKKRTLRESWKPGKTRTAVRGGKKHTDDHTFDKVLLQVPLLESFLCRSAITFFFLRRATCFNPPPHEFSCSALQLVEPLPRGELCRLLRHALLHDSEVRLQFSLMPMCNICCLCVQSVVCATHTSESLSLSPRIIRRITGRDNVVACVCL